MNHRHANTHHRSVEQSDVDNALVDALQSDGLDAWSWATAGAVFVGAVVVSRIAKFVVRRALRRRVDTALAELIARLLGYVVVVIGLVYSL